MKFTEELLPCPFCGSAKIDFVSVRIRMDGDWARAVCQGCFCKSPEFRTDLDDDELDKDLESVGLPKTWKARIAQRWNRRVKE